MAGGDLDGDLYFVCWDKNLLPRKPNFPPMEYEAPPKKEETAPITVPDMTRFVINYIRCDQLGVIDNAHKALADNEKHGVESPICLHLAELHSLAVDAPKTGMWPEMPEMGKIRFPDFMMKTDRETYPSEKLLGKLYRRCRKYKDTASEKYSQKTRLDKAFLLPGHERYIDNARQQYQQYCDQIQGLMAQYGIETEAEVFTGCFVRLRNRLRKEKSDIAELVSDLLFALRSDFRARFFEEFGLSGQPLTSKSQVTDEMRLKASAWYLAAYSDQGPDPLHENKRLLGFPWLVDDVVLAMKQGPTCGAARDVDVCSTVGDSLARVFNEEKAWLLDEFKTRVRAKNSIGRHLNVSSPGLQFVMVGSSATLLLHTRSDLDLCIVPRNAVEEIGSREGRQREVLKGLQPHLIEEETQTPKNKETNLFKNVRLVNREKFPVLTCKKPTDKLISDCQCPTTLVCDLGFYADALPMSILMSNYMKSYPDLLLILRVIHRWGHVTGLSRHTKSAGIISNVLAALLLVQCLRKGIIQNFNQSAISSKKEQLLQGKVTDGEVYMEWEKVIRFLEESTTGHNSTSLDSRQLGEILLTFFQSHSTSFEREIPDPLASILHVRKIAELLDPEHLVLVKEHMQQAYHYLALYGDVDMMLAISGSENYTVIFLPSLLSSCIKGLENSKAQAIAKKTGASSVIIRPRLPRSCASLILEVKGSDPAINAVERELERMAAQASRDRVSLMSGCFVKGASVLLFEGSRSVNDVVTLNPYYGAHHPTHDCQILHVPLLRTAHPDGYTFRCFTEKVFSQLRILERDFNPEVHGYYEFVVHFGRIYVFSVPQSLLEDNEPMTIAMLRANKRIRGMHQSHRDVPSEVTYAGETRATRRPKKRFSGKENQSKRKKGKPSRSSFFTVVRSPDRVESFLRSQGFQSDSSVTETYLVDIREDDSEFGVRFDSKLKFKEIKIPNLRWCVADVKRTWIASENPDDDVIEDGRELDIRFLLQSRYDWALNDILGTKYAKYEQILEDGLPGQAFKVKEDLWKHIKLVRFSKTHRFYCASPGRGSLMDFSVYLDEVTEYSRPAECTTTFNQQSTRWEVTFHPRLPEDLTARTTMKTFLEDVWAFSFALSSFVSSDNAH